MRNNGDGAGAGESEEQRNFRLSQEEEIRLADQQRAGRNGRPRSTQEWIVPAHSYREHTAIMSGLGGQDYRSLSVVRQQLGRQLSPELAGAIADFVPRDTTHWLGTTTAAGSYVVFEDLNGDRFSNRVVNGRNAHALDGGYRPELYPDGTHHRFWLPGAFNYGGIYPGMNAHLHPPLAPGRVYIEPTARHVDNSAVFWNGTSFSAIPSYNLQGVPIPEARALHDDDGLNLATATRL